MVNIMALSGRTVGIVIAPGFDDKQAARVMQELRLRDARMNLIGTGETTAVAMAGNSGALIKPDITLSEAAADDLDAIIIIGGKSIERLTLDEKVMTLLVAMQQLGKPVAALGNGPLAAVAAGIATGRRVAGNDSLRDQASKADAEYTESELAVDHKLITAKDIEDLTSFMEAIALLMEPATTLR